MWRCLGACNLQTRLSLQRSYFVNILSPHCNKASFISFLIKHYLDHMPLMTLGLEPGSVWSEQDGWPASLDRGASLRGRLIFIYKDHSSVYLTFLKCVFIVIYFLYL